MKKEIAKDPWEPRLKCITGDECTMGGMPAWVVRSYNTGDMFADARTAKPNVNYGTVVVKSLWWPGSFNFFDSGKVTQFYCGNG